ncbi:MAG: RdgB/HAM1 family non-canonical purine NTP pyrophosphatase [Eubacterium sp.]|jgi:XTP/dITP diphosphohydrolase|nr:RdgB/HAM1 family non-canonical purine NTP pyrophosphatase [Eubacterium sp.]
MKKVIIATNNKYKSDEIKEILAPLGYKATSLSEADIDIEIEETGKTFSENARIKAKAVFDIVKTPVIADDSGLEIEFLNGAPGVLSARYGGEKLSGFERCGLILDKLHGVKKPLRKARFVCAIHCILDERHEFSVSGEISGFIGESLIGENGFGYDPIFMINERESMATILSEKKNEISHRGRALKSFLKEMNKYNDGWQTESRA